MNADLLQGFYLGEFLVEPLKGQVTGRTGGRHLPPRAVEVLLCLAHSPGELVQRQALLDKAWGPGQGSSEALGHAISEIRHALDDHHDDPVFIQTVPRRGYRLVVTPELAATADENFVISAGIRPGGISLFENLKRRGVIETGIAYLVFGWLLIQVADIVFTQLRFADWTGTFVTVLVIAGFPIALLLSWFLEFREGRARIDDNSVIATRRRRLSRTYKSVVGALVVASGLVFVYAQYVGLPTTPPPAAVEMSEPEVADNTIAVLPFLNVDGSDDTQIFANGFVDDVINRLARVPGLLVSSRGDSFTLEPNTPSARVRQRLRVAMYLEGSVQMTGDQIRVIVQLINSATGFHVLSRTFDRPREDFFDIRDEVTDLTVSSLRVALPEGMQEMSAASSRNPDLDAYVLYRRGVEELQRPGSVNSASSAIGWFDAALEVDPEYAAALAGKCSAFTELYSETKVASTIADAEQACARALELNPQLHAVHNSLGRLHRQTGDYDAAAAAYGEALRLNPNSVDAMIRLASIYRLQQRASEAEKLLRTAVGLQPGNWSPQNALGHFLYRQGRFAEAAEEFQAVIDLDESNVLGLNNLGASYTLAGNFAAAIPAYQRSIEIEPRATTYSNLGLMYYYLGRFDEAIDALRKGIEMAPGDHLLWMNLGDVLHAAERADEAADAFSEADRLVRGALAVNPNDPGTLMDHAWISAMLGNEEQAFAQIDKSLVATPDDPYGHYVEGLINNEFGRTDAALDSLERAAARGYSRKLLAAEPHLASLRDHPRFRDNITAE